MTLSLGSKSTRNEKAKIAEGFIVIHPLDDEPETKRSTDGLTPLRFTGIAAVAMFALRLYLCGMAILVILEIIKWAVHR
jgi:hypothetical protein